MFALFNFQSLLLVLLLLICTSAYAHYVFPGIMDRNRDGVFGPFWKCARVGERLSPYVSICCVLMAVSVISKWSYRSYVLSLNEDDRRQSSRTDEKESLGE